jgi:ribonucleoside-diphosphate reductase alpha chain
MVDHPNIKSTTSIVDFVFRCLAYEYLNRTDLVHVLDKPEIMNTGNDAWDTPGEKTPELSDVRVIAPATGTGGTSSPSIKIQRAAAVKAENSTQEYMKSMQSDAPACNTCGHITVRSGTCYKCLNCGNSMGCS